MNLPNTTNPFSNVILMEIFAEFEQFAIRSRLFLLYFKVYDLFNIQSKTKLFNIESD